MGVGAVREPDAGPLVRPGQPAGEAVVGVLAAQAAVAEATLPQCLADVNVEVLHDLRVAVRRSRTVLSQLRRVLPRKERKEVAGNLRWVQAITSATRDLDVLLLRWEELERMVPADRRGELGSLYRLVRSHRDAAQASMAAQLGGPTFVARWSTWQRFASLAGGAAGRRKASAQPIEHLVAPRIGRAADRVVQDGAGLDATTQAGALHDLRKHGKQLRYLLELFGEVCVPEEQLRQGISELKRLQDDLGWHQDDVVQIDLFVSLRPRLASEPGGMAGSASVLDLLVEALVADQQLARQAVVRHLARGLSIHGAVTTAS